jgi:hypothetical protein
MRGPVRSWRSADSYGPAIILIAVTYVLATTATAPWMISTLLLVQAGTVGYVLHASRCRLALRLCASLVFLLALLAAAANVVAADRTMTGLAFLAASVLYLLAPLSVIFDLGRRRDVDQELMLGALATFLMIGMAFAFAYRCLAALQSGPFYGDAGDGTLADSLFFSFVTLTTTGYGNLVPAGNPGQSLAVLEALIGQLFLVTAVAKVVNVWRPRSWRNRPVSADPGEDAA